MEKWMMVDSSCLTSFPLTLLFESLGSAAYTFLKKLGLNTFIQKGKSKEIKVEIICMH